MGDICNTIKGKKIFFKEKKEKWSFLCLGTDVLFTHSASLPLLCWPNSSFLRGSHSTWLRPGQPQCPISLATVVGTWTAAEPDLSTRSDVWKLGKSVSHHLWDHELKGSVACRPLDHNQRKHVSINSQPPHHKAVLSFRVLFALMPKKTVWGQSFYFLKYKFLSQNSWGKKCPSGKRQGLFATSANTTMQASLEELRGAY